MLFDTKPGIGSHKGRSLIRVSATKNALSAISSALRDALNERLMDILKLIYLTAKGVASVLRSAIERQ